MYSFFKRVFDLFSSLFLFILLSPLFIIIIILSSLFIGFPVFFVQERSGKNMKLIKVVKFRTMNNKKDKNGNLLPDAQRSTKFGNFLRSTSLDELPQLLNIIKGDMSVIGPRPLPPQYNSYYTEEEKKRFCVRSGLIQPEVIHNSILPTWDEQLMWESEYAQKINFLLDVKIFFSVFKTLFKRTKSNYGKNVRESLIEERGKKQ